MKNVVITVPPTKSLLKRSPGFEKKTLSEYKLDLVALCSFGCAYCSSNWGNYLRINRKRFANSAEQQLGRRMYPDLNPEFMIRFEDVIPALESELRRKRPDFGADQTLVFSMQTDGFSPPLVADGTSRSALDLLLARTAFRIRILTKNSVVGSPEWVRFFSSNKNRFVVGLSVGTMDNEWARAVERGTSLPSARLQALRALQDAGVPTFGMLCPVFPHVLAGDGIEALIRAIRPELCEDVWVEPFNDRVNWKNVVQALDAAGPAGRRDRDVLKRAYELGNSGVWSAYATELYVRTRAIARRDGWVSKLKFLLYEKLINERDAAEFAGLEGVLLQGTRDDDGVTQNAHLAMHDSVARRHLPILRGPR